MPNTSKAWLVLVCLLSYFFMGQAGCQTMSQDDLVYIRSDLVRMKRDIEDIKQKLESPVPQEDQDIMRNQAAQREALIELQEGQQRLESRGEETRYELATLRQEITNLKLNLVTQMEALRVACKGTPGRTQSARAESSLPEPSPPPSVAPTPSVPPAPAVPSRPSAPSAPEAPPANDSSRSDKSRKTSEVIDYTKLYDTAYEDYVRQSYSLARSEFEEYLRQFPDTDLADNAQYWIGECYYAEGKYEEAADVFRKVISRYPTGNKVPRAMLKAGYALLQLGRDDQAKAMFQQVIDAYPLSSEADQAKAKMKTLN